MPRKLRKTQPPPPESEDSSSCSSASEADSESESPAPRARRTIKKSHAAAAARPRKQKKNKRRKISLSSTESGGEEESTYETVTDSDIGDESGENNDSSEETSESSETDDAPARSPAAGGKGIFIVLGGREEDSMEDSDDEIEFSKEYSAEDEKNFMKEDFVEMPTVAATKPKRKSRAETPPPPPVAEPVPPADAREEYRTLIELKKQLHLQLDAAPAGHHSRVLKNAILDCEKSIKKLVRTTRDKNTKCYMRLLRGGARRENKDTELDYFRRKMSNSEQLKIMDEIRAVNGHVVVDKPYRLSLLEAKLPVKCKAMAIQRLNMLSKMNPSDGEYFKIKNWLDSLMRIPFGVYKELAVGMEDGLDACDEFLRRAKQTLDESVYGLSDAKAQILQMVGQWMANPAAIGSAIAIKGPWGTGKTSLAKEGISRIFGREFAFVPLGGAADSSYLIGHSYTYEGSMYGRIVQILMESKSMNPIIYFDELDKVSDTPRGEEIINVLIHLIDSTQNCQFHDRFFSDIEFDLSKCLFIFSYNDESKVSPILRDRMYCIQTKGYESKEKVVIAQNFLLPRIREQVKFAAGDIVVPDDVIQYIVGKTELTKGEEGVRNLKRCLEIILTKLNLYRLIKPDTDLGAAAGGAGGLKVSFPHTVSRRDVDVLVKNTTGSAAAGASLYSMYI